MKYYIFINQYAVLANGLDLDIIDLAIFDFIKSFANSDKCVKMQTPEGVYFWISHKLILEEMPILNIKTNQGLMKRVEKLINAGILKKHPNCEHYRQTLYCFGENYDILEFANNVNQPPTEVYNPQQKFRGTPNESLGITPNESLGYNNINNNNIINKEVEEQTFSLARQLNLDHKTISVDSRIFTKVDQRLSTLVFPFDDDNFKRQYFILCCMPKWRNKTVQALQMQLNKLQKYDLGFVFELIENSIMNEWQGLVYQDTDKRYAEWQKNKSSKGVKNVSDADLIKYLNNDFD